MLVHCISIVFSHHLKLSREKYGLLHYNFICFKNLDVPFCRSDNDCYMIGGKCNHSNGICYLPIYTLEPIIITKLTTDK